MRPCCRSLQGSVARAKQATFHTASTTGEIGFRCNPPIPRYIGFVDDFCLRCPKQSLIVDRNGQQPKFLNLRLGSMSIVMSGSSFRRMSSRRRSTDDPPYGIRDDGQANKCQGVSSNASSNAHFSLLYSVWQCSPRMRSPNQADRCRSTISRGMCLIPAKSDCPPLTNGRPCSTERMNPRGRSSWIRLIGIFTSFRGTIGRCATASELDAKAFSGKGYCKFHERPNGLTGRLHPR